MIPDERRVSVIMPLLTLIPLLVVINSMDEMIGIQSKSPFELIPIALLLPFVLFMISNVEVSIRFVVIPPDTLIPVVVMNPELIPFVSMNPEVIPIVVMNPE